MILHYSLLQQKVIRTSNKYLEEECIATLSSNDNMLMIETIIMDMFGLKQVENDDPMGKERDP